jgi:hypothetical protein
MFQRLIEPHSGHVLLQAFLSSLGRVIGSRVFFCVWSAQVHALLCISLREIYLVGASASRWESLHQFILQYVATRDL